MYTYVDNWENKKCLLRVDVAIYHNLKIEIIYWGFFYFFYLFIQDICRLKSSHGKLLVEAIGCYSAFFQFFVKLHYLKNWFGCEQVEISFLSSLWLVQFKVSKNIKKMARIPKQLKIFGKEKKGRLK